MIYNRNKINNLKSNTMKLPAVGNETIQLKRDKGNEVLFSESGRFSLTSCIDTYSSYHSGKISVPLNKIRNNFKMRKMKTIILTLLFVLFLTACDDIYPNYKYFRGKGICKTELHNMPVFTAIESSIAANITIIHSSIPTVSVTAQENLLPYIQTNVVNGKLYISTGNRSMHSDSLISIKVSVPDIEEISLSGFGIISSDIPVERISLSGVGEISCSGQTNDVQASLTGSGTINLVGMRVSNADVHISGTGNIKVNVKEQLYVSISGVGNVYYLGNPEIKSSISGIGSINQLD
jgi:hypothetical protein